ncbi:hypothetical protein N7G274_007499 [Stereocaulon virgatum]|uniref:Haloacid dehalogenase n=1 Tax=Stereocaulon virgatum TaxID=373712 RepID=A0ABR4A2H0_9LECA
MNIGLEEDQPKALLFDVFGTVVDWRTTVTKHLKDRASEKLNAPSSSIKKSTRKACVQVSWPYFAQDWRDSYYAFTGDQAKKSTSPEPGHTTSFFADLMYPSHVQTSVSNPEALEEMIRSNPMLRDGGSIAQQLMQDPDVIKPMMDPKAYANP